jgi:hypothetical protein
VVAGCPKGDRSRSCRSGRHKGKALDDLPDDYLNWILENCVSLKGSLRRALEDEFERRGRERSMSTETQADTAAPQARPKAISIIAENIPENLKRTRQWVTWRYELRDAKWTKPPYQVNGRERASSTDPSTWGAFEDALETYETGRVDGLGFVVSADDDFIGIDLDHCFDLNTHTVEP